MFSRYQDFCVFVKTADFKICDIIISIVVHCNLHSCFFILKPKSYQNENGQILVCCMINIFSMFLAEWWRLETSSMSFYDFIKMAIQQDLAIFNGWHRPFLTVLYLHFEKHEKLESWHIWLLSNWGRLLTQKGPGI